MLPATSGISSGVFMPPARVKPSATPLGEPASRLSKLIGRRKGGEKYQSASESSRSAWSTSETAQPLSAGGVSSKTGPAGETSASAGIWPVSRGAEPDGGAVEGRAGGPATGAFNLLGALAAWCPPALVDMLDTDLGRRFEKRPGQRASGPSPLTRYLGTFAHPIETTTRSQSVGSSNRLRFACRRIQGKRGGHARLTLARPYPAEENKVHGPA